MKLIQVLANQKKQGRLQLDPRTKLFILLIGNLGVLFAPSLRYEIFLAGSAIVFGLFCGVYRSSLIMAAVYCLLITLQILGAAYLVGVWKISIVAFISFCRKIFPCAMLGGVLIATTKVNEFMAALNRLRISKTIFIPLVVLLRYFPMMKEEWEHIRNAMKMRGISPSFWAIIRHPVTTLEYVYVPMLIAASNLADQLSAAAITRGIDNPSPRTCLQQVGFHALDAVSAGGALLLLAAAWL